ncbi:uncharacterized protein ALTATR162_LOCUS3453 [Alternaria atra]|uniref:Uncharacterized protein n=1 Tax=Alternaria atra TaxID=119953 RepID=A0A8J2HWV2_9PLEO|nr:uncharacterized protein ALTATR162_LOCUS3453 [Alternaria atra]CAG5154070.1 unnamed protein product [Alternaria atra]
MAPSIPATPSPSFSRSTPASPISRPSKKVHRPRKRVPAPASRSNTGKSVNKKSKKDVTISELHNPLWVDFEDQKALERGQGKNRPSKFYRYHFENAATLSLFVNKINHISHKEVLDLKLQDGNAFQSVGTLKPNLDITKERIDRHYKVKQMKNPSPYISAMSSLKDAEDTVRKMYKTRTSAPRRLLIAEIDVSGLVPATLKTTMSTTQGDHSSDKSDPRTSSTNDRDVEITIWVLDAVPYEGSSAIRPSRKLDEILDSGGLIWLSVNELTRSDMELWAMKSHENEWLALSRIPEGLVTNVMPFDGAFLHSQKGYEVVRSRLSEEIYLWNFEIKMWVHDPDLADFRPYRIARDGEEFDSDSD